MNRFTSIHFWVDLCLIATFSIVLAVYGMNVRENVWLFLGLLSLFVATGINGYVGGIRDGVNIIKGLK